MDRRTYESPMDWEYQNNAPVDPSSPFVQSTKRLQAKGIFGSSSLINNKNNSHATFGQNPFERTQSTPSSHKAPPLTPHPPSIFSTSTLQRTATAPPFRNPAFTTPRKPIDSDALSEFSPAESSPAVTDVSDYPDTPENEHSSNLAHMTITPANMSKFKAPSPKKASGRGEIARTIFASRDKVRKRKRYNADRDVSGYRLPYLQQDECDESDYESDESTFQPSKSRKDQTNRSKDGWFGAFLATVQRHPYAPSILGYWLTFAFNLFCVSATCWVGWAVIDGLRQDFSTERQALRADILAEIDKCSSDYRENRCFPVDKRLPAMYELCDQWFACMNQNPDNVKQVSSSAKEMAKILNEIVETMSYKTIALLLVLFTIFAYSGRSLYKSANAFTDIPQSHPPAPFPSHQAGDQHLRPLSQQVYWQAIQPQTPRHTSNRHLLVNEETPDTDEVPRYALPPPETPMSRRSPSKGERGRSPTKSRSPVKRY
ncbi:Di-sulfide bridge nucleocytoplasmic transport domain-containing protein [Daldinia loculata]|uniref:Di-sulfide bridge nucleocytoplasmic transport domain-containing protein n=1 Tax=Daldinia loculata TaxID=103429 RepID=UPI0020C53361|nr:Di-sulfide bridge nucleocytoplasmic transport domain-containing protein [Daldinia loculata]KAI1642542.1 Di-sulfide bridge nucleocytoplasmic transport domain-containing protein [Daldinia loculata]